MPIPAIPVNGEEVKILQQSEKYPLLGSFTLGNGATELWFNTEQRYLASEATLENWEARLREALKQLQLLVESRRFTSSMVLDALRRIGPPASPFVWLTTEWLAKHVPSFRGQVQPPENLTPERLKILQAAIAHY